MTDLGRDFWSMEPCAWSLRRLASVNPPRPRPPTRRKLRRLMPSQNGCLRPQNVNMVQPSAAGRNQAGPESGDRTHGRAERLGAVGRLRSVEPERLDAPPAQVHV